MNPILVWSYRVAVDRRIEVFFSSRPDLDALGELRWRRSDDRWVAQGRGWDADVVGPTVIEPDDAPAEATELEPGISWHVELNVSSESEEAERNGMKKVMAAAQKLAGADGVIADEDRVWKGQQPKRRWTPPRDPGYGEPAILTMTWFVLPPTLSSPDSVSALLETVQRVLPQAMPVRWGKTEPLGHGPEDEGNEG